MVSCSWAPIRATAPPSPTAVLPEKSESLMVVGPNSASSPPPQALPVQPAAVLFMKRTLVMVRLDTVEPPVPVQPPPSGAQPKKSTAPPRKLKKGSGAVLVLLPFRKITLLILRLALPVVPVFLVEMNLSFQAVPLEQANPDEPPHP